MLWIAWAVIVWNVVFDHVIVVAGRSYIAAARQAAAVPGRPFANMDDWMRPAVTRAFWIASAAGGAIVLAGMAAARSAEAFPPPLAERAAGDPPEPSAKAGAQ